MSGPEESDRYGSAGRLAVNAEAKIVDPDSGETLPPGQRGELWIRGPTIMKGDAYIYKTQSQNVKLWTWIFLHLLLLYGKKLLQTYIFVKGQFSYNFMDQVEDDK